MKMNLPDLNLFPKPPPGKEGWPWADPLQEVIKSNNFITEFPKITIVTPSYNQSQYIEETIRSVLLQGYPNLEYIIIDGGSTDGSVEIIKKYEQWLTFWVSEPDKGQSHAINKGFAMSSGDIMAWVNSDDYYAPNAFFSVVVAFIQNRTEWVAGRCKIIELDGEITKGKGQPEDKIEKWLVSCQYTQPNVFWKRTLWDKTKKIDESFQYSFDYELWLQFAHHQTFPTWIEVPVAFFRLHSSSKTIKNQSYFEKEEKIIQKRHKRLVQSKKQLLNINYLRRVKKAEYYLSSKDDSPILIKIIYSIYYAPWYLLRLHFYFRLMNFLRQKNNFADKH